MKPIGSAALGAAPLKLIADALQVREPRLPLSRPSAEWWRQGNLCRYHYPASKTTPSV